MPDIIEETKHVIELLQNNYLVDLTNAFFDNKIKLINTIDVNELKRNRESLKKNKIYREYKNLKEKLSSCIQEVGDYLTLIKTLSKVKSGISEEDDLVSNLNRYLDDLKLSLIWVRGTASAKNLVDLLLDLENVDVKKDAMTMVTNLKEKYGFEIENESRKTEKACIEGLSLVEEGLRTDKKEYKKFLNLLYHHIIEIDKISTLLMENETGKENKTVNVPLKKEILESHLAEREIKEYFTDYADWNVYYNYWISEMCYPNLYSSLNSFHSLEYKIKPTFESLQVDSIMDLIDKQKKKKESEKLMIEEMSNPTLYVLENVKKNIQKYETNYNKLLSEGKKLVKAIDEILKKFK